ncbi:helix-turn-helix domain-containing protein [Microbacterium halotolerans]|uniref:helix-turn-helix domain-containing protein n=1 Tax=Microbacterium halotolerans TaxID=246613 RepID=UPI000E6A9BF4|nr:helix-turn-helix domain-containing protein [Microbacterium halotolerans]
MKSNAETIDAFDGDGIDETRYLTRREAAEWCRVPLSTFDSLRRQARVPFPDAQVGKHMLWKADTIAAFLERGGTRVRP